MALQTFVDKIKASKKAYNDALKELGPKQIAKALAEVIPEGFVLSVTGSTPSFNDGEPCRFSVGDWYLVTELDLADESTYENPVLGTDKRDFIPAGDDDVGCVSVVYSVSAKDYKWCGLTKANVDAVKAVVKNLDNNIMESAFGDGFHAVFRRNGKVDTDDYDCGY